MAKKPWNDCGNSKNQQSMPKKKLGNWRPTLCITTTCSKFSNTTYILQSQTTFVGVSNPKNNHKITMKEHCVVWISTNHAILKLTWRKSGLETPPLYVWLKRFVFVFFRYELEDWYIPIKVMSTQNPSSEWFVRLICQSALQSKRIDVNKLSQGTHLIFLTLKYCQECFSPETPKIKMKKQKFEAWDSLAVAWLETEMFFCVSFEKDIIAHSNQVQIFSWCVAKSFQGNHTQAWKIRIRGDFCVCWVYPMLLIWWLTVFTILQILLHNVPKINKT